MGRQLMAMCICVVALATIVAGCGSSDDESVPTPTKVVFVKQANKICKDGVGDIQRGIERMLRQRISAKQSTENDAAVIEAARTVVIPHLETQVEELQDLGLPAGDEAELEKIYASFEKGIEESEADPKGMFRGNSAELMKAREMTAKYGFQWCGQL